MSYELKIKQKRDLCRIYKFGIYEIIMKWFISQSLPLILFALALQFTIQYSWLCSLAIPILVWINFVIFKIFNKKLKRQGNAIEKLENQIDALTKEMNNLRQKYISIILNSIEENSNLNGAELSMYLHQKEVQLIKYEFSEIENIMSKMVLNSRK